jgi:hypothetical protein
MGWLHVFSNVLHAAETAAKLAAPFVSAVNPIVGGLMLQATTAAVSVEVMLATAPGKDKAAVVAKGTQATVDAINAILVSQGKNPLPASTTDQVQAVVKTVVTGLKAIAIATPETYPITYGKFGQARRIVQNAAEQDQAILDGYVRVVPV